MGKIPDELREAIARNIRECRIKKFPGRGGGKKCAEAFGVSPQQWSPWERGMRTPDELRLSKIAEFFETTVEWLRRDHRLTETPNAPENPFPGPQTHVAGQPSLGGGSPFSGISGVDVPPPPSWQPAQPGSPESFFWLARHFVDSIMRDGLTLRLDRETTLFLASLFLKK